MKTTLELPDDLLVEAKSVAARRRTTLKELVTRSLRREIRQTEVTPLPPESPFEIGSLGLPVIKGSGRTLSANDYQDLIDKNEIEEDLNKLNPST